MEDPQSPRATQSLIKMIRVVDCRRMLTFQPAYDFSGATEAGLESNVLPPPENAPVIGPPHKLAVR